MHRMLRRLMADDAGQDLVEYAILAALLATVSIAAISLLGAEVSKFFIDVNGKFPPS